VVQEAAGSGSWVQDSRCRCIRGAGRLPIRQLRPTTISIIDRSSTTLEGRGDERLWPRDPGRLIIGLRVPLGARQFRVFPL